MQFLREKKIQLIFVRRVIFYGHNYLMLSFESRKCLMVSISDYYFFSAFIINIFCKDEIFYIYQGFFTQENKMHI